MFSILKFFPENSTSKVSPPDQKSASFKVCGAKVLPKLLPTEKRRFTDEEINTGYYRFVSIAPVYHIITIKCRSFFARLSHNDRRKIFKRSDLIKPWCRGVIILALNDSPACIARLSTIFV